MGDVRGRTIQPKSGAGSARKEAYILVLRLAKDTINNYKHAQDDSISVPGGDLVVDRKGLNNPTSKVGQIDKYDYAILMPDGNKRIDKIAVNMVREGGSIIPLVTFDKNEKETAPMNADLEAHAKAAAARIAKPNKPYGKLLSLTVAQYKLELGTNGFKVAEAKKKETYNKTGELTYKEAQ